MPLTSRSEDILERLVFGLGIAVSEAESGRPADPAEFRARVVSLCKKWREDIETLINATDPALHAGVNLLSVRQENAALKAELDALKKENAALKERPAAETAAPKAPPEKPQQKAPEQASEKTQAKTEDKSEFSQAMKDVKRY